MIFVTVGMHHQGFDRLISAMDEVAKSIDEPVVMQIGSASYEPSHSEWFRFADGERVNELIASARIVVAHAGAGTIISAFKSRRPLVVVPRRATLGEHVDDHQLELVEALGAEGKVCPVLEPTPTSLIEAISQAAQLQTTHEHNSHKLRTALSNILGGSPSV